MMILYWNIRSVIKPNIVYKNEELFNYIVKNYPDLPSIKILQYE